MITERVELRSAPTRSVDSLLESEARPDRAPASIGAVTSAAGNRASSIRGSGPRSRLAPQGSDLVRRTLRDRMRSRALGHEMSNAHHNARVVRARDQGAGCRTQVGLKSLLASCTMS